MKLNLNKFKPLPERMYDLNRFESYPHSLINKEREYSPKWRCYAIFSPSLQLLIIEKIKEHQCKECYIQDIFEDDLVETFTNSKNQ